MFHIFKNIFFNTYKRIDALEAELNNSLLKDRIDAKVAVEKVESKVADLSFIQRRLEHLSDCIAGLEELLRYNYTWGFDAKLNQYYSGVTIDLGDLVRERRKYVDITKVIDIKARPSKRK